MAQSSSMAAVLLAGGLSRRFGSDKTSLLLNGESLVERHLRQLRGIGVTHAVIVCNEHNLYTIRTRAKSTKEFRIDAVLQIGEGMGAAVRSGLLVTDHQLPTYIVCVNDVVEDAAYLSIEQLGRSKTDLVIPSILLTQSFTGGCLEISEDKRFVFSIVEKPTGGCNAGSPANIMIHRLADESVTTKILAGLDLTLDYEDSINKAIKKGIRAKVAWLTSWFPIKNTEDYLAASRSVALRSGTL